MSGKVEKEENNEIKGFFRGYICERLWRNPRKL